MGGYRELGSEKVSSRKGQVSRHWKDQRSYSGGNGERTFQEEGTVFVLEEQGHQEIKLELLERWRGWWLMFQEEESALPSLEEGVGWRGGEA